MEKDKLRYYTYISYYLNNTFQGVGVTINLIRRFNLLDQLHCKLKGDCCKLVYFEEFEDSSAATQRENELNDLPKKMLRELVVDTNPMFVNLLKV